MALKEYIGLSRLTQAFSLLKSKIDGKEDTPTVISYGDFMELTPQQQTSGYYLVVGGTPITNAYGISYQPNKTVGDALDDHADAIDELSADITDKADKDLSNVTGTLDAAHGGTGQTTLQATRNAMGLGNTTGALPIANGGTGSTTAANARTALGLGGAATQAVANNLTTTAAGYVLDARQGKALNDKLVTGNGGWWNHNTFYKFGKVVVVMGNSDYFVQGRQQVPAGYRPAITISPILVMDGNGNPKTATLDTNGYIDGGSYWKFYAGTAWITP